jgi:hypothetical protein
MSLFYSCSDLFRYSLLMMWGVIHLVDLKSVMLISEQAGNQSDPICKIETGMGG